MTWLRNSLHTYILSSLQLNQIQANMQHASFCMVVLGRSAHLPFVALACLHQQTETNLFALQESTSARDVPFMYAT